MHLFCLFFCDSREFCLDPIGKSKEKRVKIQTLVLDFCFNTDPRRQLLNLLVSCEQHSHFHWASSTWRGRGWVWPGMSWREPPRSTPSLLLSLLPVLFCCPNLLAPFTGDDREWGIRKHTACWLCSIGISNNHIQICVNCPCRALAPVST